jgi:hypothetical protein
MGNNTTVVGKCWESYLSCLLPLPNFMYISARGFALRSQPKHAPNKLLFLF